LLETSYEIPNTDLEVVDFDIGQIKNSGCNDGIACFTAAACNMKPMDKCILPVLKGFR
jgi:hypothetical protein